jgi:hypothetical protein
MERLLGSGQGRHEGTPAGSAGGERGVMKVYLVTSGQYSDYRVEAVFSTIERAESYKTGVQYANDVEEYDLDPEEPPRLKEGESLFYVHMMKNGSVDFCRACTEDPSIFVQERWGVQNIHGATRLDREHAIKVANERRASLLATGNWMPGISSDTFKEE